MFRAEVAPRYEGVCTARDPLATAAGITGAALKATVDVVRYMLCAVTAAYATATVGDPLTINAETVTIGGDTIEW